MSRKLRAQVCESMPITHINLKHCICANMHSVLRVVDRMPLYL